MVNNGKIKEVTEDMGMLKSISLENYKCFKEKTDIEIAPLTVLCGVNSSGKSSILKSLLMLKQSYENTEATNQMTFNGSYVDNGSFREIISENPIKKSFTLTNQFSIEKLDPSAGTKEYTLYRDLYRLFYNSNITKFVITNSLEVIASDGFVNPNKINEFNIEIRIFIEEILLMVSSVSLQKYPSENKYMVVCKNIPDVSGKTESFTIDSCKCYFSGMTLNSIYKNKLDNRRKVFIPSIVTIFKLISSQYSLVNYIAPIRENPKRTYVLDHDIASVGISGENTALLLKKVYNNTITGIVAPYSDDYKDNVFDIVSKTKFNVLLQSWMNYLELGIIELDDRQQDIIKINVNRHNISDVGFGVSQSLPILVEGLSIRNKQTLLLEQPEIHLHPKMQMRIADFLLSLAMQDKQVIVETHSDHIINRLVRRALESEKFHDKIQIYFIDKNDEGFSFKEDIIIDPIDGAICENENFFYQFASETEKIIDAGYKNLEKKRQSCEDV